jgi:hypothetical protein
MSLIGLLNWTCLRKEYELENMWVESTQNWMPRKKRMEKNTEYSKIVEWLGKNVSCA